MIFNDQMNPGDEAPIFSPSTGEDVCPECNGKGKIENNQQCTNCGGTGIVIKGIGGG